MLLRASMTSKVFKRLLKLINRSTIVNVKSRCFVQIKQNSCLHYLCGTTKDMKKNLDRANLVTNNSLTPLQLLLHTPKNNKYIVLVQLHHIMF